MPKRIILSVTVDLDPVPGPFHDPSDARKRVQEILNDRIAHYNPTVYHLANLATSEEAWGYLDGEVLE